MTACPACAGENAADARFCSHCGRPLTAGDVGGKAERRLVTVMFADITGSTPLGEALDPEDLTEVLGSYELRCVRRSRPKAEPSRNSSATR